MNAREIPIGDLAPPAEVQTIHAGVLGGGSAFGYPAASEITERRH